MSFHVFRAAGLAAGLTFTIFTGQAHAETGPLFSYRGKEVRAADLPVAAQLSLFEIEEERFGRLTAKLDDLILGQHLEAISKAKGISREEAEKKELAIADPSDKDASEWFESNKNRLPPQYTLDQIKDEIKTHLRQERAAAKRTEILSRLKDKGEAKILLVAPEAPRIAMKTDGHPERGTKGAKVTIVEFADYQCPHCKAAGESIDKVMKTFAGKVKLVFLDFPVNPSGISLAVAHGAVCADEQGRYWDYHDKAFSKQQDLTKDSPLALARELSLDEKKFQACISSSRPQEKVAKAKAEAERLGLSGTPAIFVNGRRVRSYQEPDLIQVIQDALKTHG